MSCVGVGIVLCCIALLGFGSCCVVLYCRDSKSLATMLRLRCGCVLFALWCLLMCVVLSLALFALCLCRVALSLVALCSSDHVLGCGGLHCSLSC